MVVGLAALGAEYGGAFSRRRKRRGKKELVAKKKKRRREKSEEQNKRTTVKFAAMMATFIVKPVTFTGAFVLREVYRSLALLGETNKDDGLLL